MLSFEQKLINYAQLALHYGLGFDTKARPLYVTNYSTEDHDHFLAVLAREAYKAGAPTVNVTYRNPHLDREQFLGAPEEYKLHVHAYETERAKEIIARDGANLALYGNADLGVMVDVDPKYPSGMRAAHFKASEPLTTRRIAMQSVWSLMGVPTNAWARMLGMSVSMLWEFLFQATGADRPDCIDYALAMSDSLHRRCELLNGLRFSAIKFIGDGTDLTVGLMPRSRWIGGRVQAEDGTWFGPNWPSFEIFTTPDFRRTEGHVRMTMPVVLSGPVVSGLDLVFEQGRIVSATAIEGEAAYRALIATDEGASRLGEVALVGLDAPLSNFHQPHYHTLFDENKRGHIATGRAYAAALEGGTGATSEQLEEWGCNKSSTHTDIMITDENTSVFGLDDEGAPITRIMRNGQWLV